MSEPSKNTRPIAIALMGLMLLLTGLSYAFKFGPISLNLWGQIHTDSGLANGGYDVVAYHNAKNALEGDKRHSFTTEGMSWHFSEAQNRQLFAASPMSFLPQFGGYCAYASSFGFSLASSGEHWSEHKGKVYLFSSAKARELWLGDKEAHIAAAQAHWR